MKVYHSIRDIKRVPSGSVVAVGIFDGIHRGHVHIIKALIKRARRLGKKSVVLTFYPHPFLMLHPKRLVPLLISLKHRIRLLRDLGVDIVVLVKFTKAFSRVSPEAFVKRILLKKLGMKEMLVADNFTFGRQGSGDIRLLERLSKDRGFALMKIDLLRAKGKIVSSTYIRSLIMGGRLNEASRLLGRPVSILGTVKKGTKRGRILGFRTANIDPHHEAIPPSGVYAVYVRLKDRRYRGILNIGFRPTFHPLHYSPEPTIEVHIFNFNRDIYKRDLEIIFVKRLRPEKRFSDKEALIRRIRSDKRATAKIFKRA